MPDSTPGHPSRGSSSAGGEGASGSDAARLDLAAADAEAEAAAAAATAAAAEATAAAARAHAARLRRDSDVGAQAAGAADDPTPTVTLTKEYGETPATDWQQEPGRRRKGPAWTILTSAAVVVICAALAATGYMTYQHRQAESDRDQAAEYAAAAKQGVVTLTSLDFNNAEADIQRVLDSSTGEFRDDFQSRKDDFAKVIQDSKVATEGQVNSTAVESMNDNDAVVLVSATSKVTNSAGADQEPRAWRLAVTVTHEGDQIKMSKVDYVP
ncbi:hypothetical protein OG921_14170 [Aldersonia sp. NBC_00410]|uniref:hypothetical protein n=1 Tax=Aldersonia sp. NBC_00410 TaxID=2975954 RepID=UPI00224CE433|nr:hypothetical protein [Aldersonia sp. NBC_00410]MCX5044314.1 hypothetical protein [Aldersonia sp. NBC_00410]